MALSIKEKLKQLDKTISEAKPAVAENSSQEQRFDLIGGKLIRTATGQVVVREKSFPLEFIHGPNQLEELLKMDSEYFAYVGKDTALTNLDIRTSVFIDTETTGLAGGAGTYAFLIGIGYFTGNSFLVKQLFMPDYHNEPAVLALLAAELRTRSAFISYNGKAYDIPILKSRFVLNRLSFQDDNYLHLDLLHAARRLWKRNLGECTLQNIERHILGFQRHDDIPGYEIPQKYFDYLYSKDVSSLLPIFKHNAMDILSLVSITLSAGRVFDKCEYPSDSTAVMKTFSHLGDVKRSKQFMRNSAFQTQEVLCALYQARLFKRMSLLKDAEKQWLWLIEQSRDFHIEPYIELAKLYEHNYRNISKALEIVNRLEERLQIRHELFSLNEHKYLTNITHRKNRLNRKLRNQNLTGGKEKEKVP